MITKFAKRTVVGLFAVVWNNIKIGLSLSNSVGIGGSVGRGRFVLDGRTRILPELLLLSSFSPSPLFVRRTTIKGTTRRKSDFVLSASSSLNFVEKEKGESDDDDALVRWERMYQQGKQEQISFMKAPATENSNNSNTANKHPIGTHVRVVTFDLDNTLWKTSETISAANDALAIYLSNTDDGDGNPIKVPKRIEQVMGDLFRDDRRKYCPLNGRETANATSNGSTEENDDEEEDNLEQRCKSPVLLTQLRIDAICHVLEKDNFFSTERALVFAKLAFDEWTRARHDAIVVHLAPRVVETLDKIRTTISYNNIPVLMGAVTDGNSDPSRIETLAPYFDFCVNAESVGVSKPDSRVYLEAVRRAVKVSQSKSLHLQKSPEKQQPHLFSDLIPLELDNGNDDNKNGFFDIDDIDDETLEDMIGPYWCHIGDDFLKDIVAAKELKMRTIFAVGLVREKITENVNNNEKDNAKMDMAEFLKQVSSQNVVTIGIGADDYLANSLHGEFVDAVAHDFFDISSILGNWHVEAINSREDEINIKEPSSTLTNVEEEQGSILEVIEPSSDSSELSETPLVNKNQKGEMNFILPRAFRIIREDCSMDIPAPLRNREERTMKEVMGMAQKEISSGVFAFNPDDVASLKEEKHILMIQIGDTDLKFSREIFSGMSVQEVLGLTDENPVKLSLYMTEASKQPSFNLF